MNDNNREIKFGRVHQSADDTNLLRLSNSIKKLNKLFNADLKHIVNWVNVNKISLNVKITEMMIFKSNPKEFEGNLEIRLCGKRLNPTQSAKYLELQIDADLRCQCQFNDLCIKLNRANAFLFKIENMLVLKY